MVYADPRAEKRELKRNRFDLTVVAMVALIGFCWSLFRGIINPAEVTLAQGIFQRIDATLSSWTMGLWHVMPAFNYHDFLTASNMFAYLFLVSFIGLIIVRNKTWSKIDDHNDAQREIERERLRDRYRDEDE